MNERIKELVLEASDFMSETANWGHLPGSHNDIFHEKFAELIVRECADIAKNSQYRGASSDYYDGFNEALVYSANKIKEQFGVE